MNYKNIIKSQSARFVILRLLAWVPDSIMLRLQYRIKLGRWPNLKHPTRFTEKLQLYKMKYHNPVMSQCVDKYEVRKYVEDKGLGHILNKLYGAYETPDEISLESLPNQFVMKTTTGSGGQNVIIVKERETSKIEELLGQLRKWNGANYLGALAGREWAYKGCKNRILIEELLEDNEQQDSLVDYKFFCFNGEPKFLYVITDRKPGEYAFLGVYDIDFNKIPVYRSDERRQEYAVIRPNHFDEMLEAARILSRDFPHVRVDLYNVNGKIYFGELTFYDGSGYFQYDPDGFDFHVGSFFTYF
jgi:hypothetical protein